MPGTRTHSKIPTTYKFVAKSTYRKSADGRTFDDKSDKNLVIHDIWMDSRNYGETSTVSIHQAMEKFLSSYKYAASQYVCVHDDCVDHHNTTHDTCGGPSH